MQSFFYLLFLPFLILPVLSSEQEHELFYLDMSAVVSDSDGHARIECWQLTTPFAKYPTVGMALHLANRKAPKGSTALSEALKLAEQLASHPQTCMRNDRASMLNQKAEIAALEKEFELGLETLQSGEFVAAIGRFLGKL